TSTPSTSKERWPRSPGRRVRWASRSSSNECSKDPPAEDLAAGIGYEREPSRRREDMTKHGKKFVDATKRFDRERLYPPTEALDLVKSLATHKFDETVEAAFRLGVDPRKADQMIRGTVSLPKGTGKDVRVAVFAEGDKAREAQDAGADIVGSD